MIISVSSLTTTSIYSRHTSRIVQAVSGQESQIVLYYQWYIDNLATTNSEAQ